MEIIGMDQNNDGSECKGWDRCSRDGRWVARYNVDVTFHGADVVMVPMCERHIAHTLTMQADARTRRNSDNQVECNG